MTYKTILVHVDGSKRCPARIGIAINLAREFKAHLVGLHALKAIELPGYIVAGAGGASVVEIQNKAAKERVARAKAMFNEAVAGNGRLNGAEWRASELDAFEAVTLHARYADLIVVGQPQAGDDAGVERGFAENVALGAGRPVLIVPYAGRFDSVGRRVLIGWDAGREATRALTDALPFLARAASVQVLVVNPGIGHHGEAPGDDIALYLARHGVRVEVNVQEGVDIDVGDEILSRAADFGADLIVMGAYGHSRIREIVMGGATRTLIDTMTAPVLMSH
jgi:nucleotide-binding universal stress UspA family protein